MPRVDIAIAVVELVRQRHPRQRQHGSVFDYLDPQWQWVMNAGWNKGAHNVKFGFDIHRLHMNHYEITAPSFTFTGGATALNATGAAAPNVQNGYADFCSGCRSRATQRCRIRC